MVTKEEWEAMDRRLKGWEKWRKDKDSLIAQCPICKRVLPQQTGLLQAKCKFCQQTPGA